MSGLKNIFILIFRFKIRSFCYSSKKRIILGQIQNAPADKIRRGAETDFGLVGNNVFCFFIEYVNLVRVERKAHRVSDVDVVARLYSCHEQCVFEHHINE